MKLNLELAENFIQFGIVGFVGLIIDFSITFFLKEKLQVNKYLSNVAGFSVAVCSNFLLNKYWTFENMSESYLIQFSIFLTAAMVGLSINHFTLYFIHNNLKVGFYWAKLVAIGVVMFWNFGMSNFVIFRLWA